MSYLSGITSGASLNATALPTTTWSVDATAEILRYVNSLTGLHPVKQSTILDASFTIGVDFDPALNPFASPISIIPGIILTNVVLFLNGPTGTTNWTFPSAIVQRIVESMTREGKILTTLYCQASGVLTCPGGVSF